MGHNIIYKISLELKYVLGIMMTLDQIVDMDDKHNKCLPWNKLNKSLKLKRVMEFVDEFSEKEHLDDSKKDQLKQMLKDKLDRKCLQRVKDVVYNNELEKIESIPSLIHTQNKYTLRSDAVSPLASLAPKNKTLKKTT
jgi:hypothetical protein